MDAAESHRRGIELCLRMLGHDQKVEAIRFGRRDQFGKRSGAVVLLKKCERE